MTSRTIMRRMVSMCFIVSHHGVIYLCYHVIFIFVIKIVMFHFISLHFISFHFTSLKFTTLLLFAVVVCCCVQFFKFLFNYKYVLDNEDDGKTSTLDSKKVRCGILFAVFISDEGNEIHDMTFGKKALADKCQCDSKVKPSSCLVTTTTTTIIQKTSIRTLILPSLKAPTNSTIVVQPTAFPSPTLSTYSSSRTESPRSKYWTPTTTSESIKTSNGAGINLKKICITYYSMYYVVTVRLVDVPDVALFIVVVAVVIAVVVTVIVVTVVVIVVTVVVIVVTVVVIVVTVVVVCAYHIKKKFSFVIFFLQMLQVMGCLWRYLLSL